jgi:release factor glutamine methyltransferase
LSFYTDIPALQLAINLDKRVGESLLLKIHFAVKDLRKFKPLQYVLGETEFNGMRFYVTESVLIPRPETEELVSLIVEQYKGEKDLQILDLGTGSGCIAVSLSQALSAKVLAADISEEALSIARRNAKLNNADVVFKSYDILGDSSDDLIEGQFDIIVSNPPYVREQEKQLMHDNVLKYEPDLALFVEDSNPLVFYKAIAKLAHAKLSIDGQLWLEINEYLGKETEALLLEHFRDVQLINDYKSNARFIKATNPR